jgi:serine protease
MHRLLATALLPIAAALAVPCAAGAQAYVPGQVVVQYEAGASPAALREATGTAPAPEPRPGPRTEVLRVTDGGSVAETIRELRSEPGVAYAVPNVLARASGFIPNDPGRLGRPGGWQALQWNFLPASGINTPDAWSNLIAAGRPGGRGVTVAVLDTGVAYENRGRFRRSPDFIANQFARGHDFVDRDRRPNDHNGHGTFVAGVIAARVHNGRALTGIAYGARIMPVRVLDEQGLGDAAAIAAGIRYAARNGAHIINLSLEFDSSVPASQIPEVLSAIRYADRLGVLVVAASGNEALRVVAYPARAPTVVSVGATTEHLCQADYSNDGRGLDLMAPGGGADAAVEDDPVHCRPGARPGRDIYQLTFLGSVRRFGIPGGYEGTSMAAPHVAGVAALVIASGVVGARPSPRVAEDRLKATARDLGPAGTDLRYGAGLVDAAAATARAPT